MSGGFVTSETEALDLDALVRRAADVEEVATALMRSIASPQSERVELLVAACETKVCSAHARL